MNRTEARILLSLKHPNPQEHYAAAISKRLTTDNSAILRNLYVMHGKNWVTRKKGLNNKFYYFLTGKVDLREAERMLRQEVELDKKQLKLC